MKICDVWELARLAGAIEGELPLRDAPRLAEPLLDTEGVLRYRLTGMTDERGRPAARLEVEGSVRARCDRCGGAVEVRIDEAVQFFFVVEERELAALPIDEAPEEPLLGSSRFDIAALVEDQAILALPISPRHAACRPDWEASEDEAARAPTQRPFAVLAALKGRGH